ncbi:MAG: diguanylate cyclase [Myxococcota bacterium]|jgi:diguanylate cyclase (GGDEF)-like protein|nr:diguanylate cyclase [Myxococcota bacterium]
MSNQDNNKPKPPPASTGFGLDWANEYREAASARKTISVGFFDTAYKNKTDRDSVRPRVVFLKGISIASRLVEQSLRRSGHVVNLAADRSQFEEMISAGRFEVALIDDSLSLPQRMDLIAMITGRPHAIPVFLLVEPSAEVDGKRAVAVGATAYFVKDPNGAYLLAVPERIEQCLPRRRPNPEPPRSAPPVVEMDSETTGQIDVSEVAKRALSPNKESKRACFVVLAGSNVGSVITLDDDVIVIGRDSTCNLQILDEGVSRFHARVLTDEHGEVIVQDMGSTNGTFVSGERISKRRLRDGDKVLVGRQTVLKFVLQDSLERTYYDEMYESSTRDALTGTYNRKYCLERMVQDLSFARRHRLPFSCLIFDLDHFKKVNDTHGHQTGDQALVSVASAVLATVRTEDVVGRYGGEEFVIVASGTDAIGGATLGERIRKIVSESEIEVRSSAGGLIHVTVSVGVASVRPGSIIDAHTVLGEADKNLYRAKEAGRNCVVATEIGEATHRRPL